MWSHYWHHEAAKDHPARFSPHPRRYRRSTSQISDWKRKWKFSNRLAQILYMLTRRPLQQGYCRQLRRPGLIHRCSGGRASQQCRKSIPSSHCLDWDSNVERHMEEGSTPANCESDFDCRRLIEGMLMDVREAAPDIDFWAAFARVRIAEPRLPDPRLSRVGTTQLLQGGTRTCCAQNQSCAHYSGCEAAKMWVEYQMIAAKFSLRQTHRI